MGWLELGRSMHLIFSLLFSSLPMLYKMFSRSSLIIVCWSEYHVHFFFYLFLLSSVTYNLFLPCIKENRKGGELRVFDKVSIHETKDPVSWS